MMTSTEKLNLIESYLKKEAKCYCVPLDNPEFYLYDQTGSNIDDAFEYGEATGKTRMARDMLKLFFTKDDVEVIGC